MLLFSSTGRGGSSISTGMGAAASLLRTASFGKSVAAQSARTCKSTESARKIKKVRGIWPWGPWKVSIDMHLYFCQNFKWVDLTVKKLKIIFRLLKKLKMQGVEK
ncbi:MAG: hypothetical protein QY316_00730 [Thermodesulfobacteriota bacterium]|nr:MAG: hypothetical protein QY316_00730 [Thermodesulfobacteriota bacterium]